MDFGYYMDQLYFRRITEIYTIEKGVTSISMLRTPFYISDYADTLTSA